VCLACFLMELMYQISFLRVESDWQRLKKNVYLSNKKECMYILHCKGKNHTDVQKLEVVTNDNVCGSNLSSTMIRLRDSNHTTCEQFALWSDPVNHCKWLLTWPCLRLVANLLCPSLSFLLDFSNTQWLLSQHFPLMCMHPFRYIAPGRIPNSERAKCSSFIGSQNTVSYIYVTSILGYSLIISVCVCVYSKYTLKSLWTRKVYLKK
jgi:hypothetical protein